MRRVLLGRRRPGKPGRTASRRRAQTWGSAGGAADDHDDCREILESAPAPARGDGAFER